jgi:hypothetical protein
MTFDPTPPRRFIPIDSACQILTDGGTPRALAAADMFLRAVAGSQGLRDPGTFVRVGVAKEGIAEAERVRLRWWQAEPDAPLFLHMADVQTLRDRFDAWIADVVPLDERTAEASGAVKLASNAPRYRPDGKEKCRAHLVTMMKNETPNADTTKGTLRPQLMEHFKISGRQYDEAWRRAVEDAEAGDSWGKAGKRPKKP